MKIPKLFKKAAAFVMAAVTALSIMPATAFAAGDIGTISFSHTYDSNGNTMRYNSSANIGGYTAGGTGNYKYRMFVDGENAFCIQPGVPLKTGNTLKKASSDTWNALSANQKKAVGLALLYGYQGNRNNLSGSDDEKWLATQTLVWEFVTGCREATGSYNQTSTTVYSLHFGSNYANSGARAVYDQIVAMLREHNTIPSFMSGGKNDITKELAYKDGKYSITLNDSNGVLSDYSFLSSDSNVSVSKSGNKLTISSTVAISGSVRITAKRNNVPTVSSSAKLIAYGDPNLQDLVTGVENADTVSAYINIETPTGTIALKKTSEDGVVEGISFTIKGDNFNKTVKTGKDGSVSVEGLFPGTYTVTEQSIDRYEPQKTQTVTLIGGKTSTVTFSNILKRGSLEIVKTSEDNLVEGMKFHLYGTSLSGLPVDEYAVTDKNGLAKFENVLISGDTPYVVEEVDTAVRYVVPASQTAPIEWNKVTKRSFDNVLKKFQVTVTKTDAETGSPQGNASLAGAVYGIYKGEELIDTYTTDENGQFTTKYYICDNDWTVREISPSEGYLLDTAIHKVGAEPELYTVELNSTANDVNEQVIKGNIALIKHTDNGETQIETPEEGAVFEVFLKSAGSYENAKETERDVLTCDENGFAQTKDMPYGIYTVRQTSGWEGRELMKDFDVFISKDGQTYRYLINNANFESYIKIVKKDAETGNTIPYAGAGFQIYDPNGNLVTMTFTYPEVTTIDTFYTTADGDLITPQTLEYGKGYSLVEVQAPYGYVLNSEPVYFDVVQENSEEESGIMDMNSDYGDGANPVILKSEFILSLCEQLIGGSTLGAKQKSIIDRCTASVYRYYQQGNYQGTPPTLQDFREELLKQNEPEAQEIALAIELFTDGSLNTFAKHTNVDTKSRLICYDILDLGKQLQPIGMLVVLDSILNRITQNRAKGRNTFIFIDEIYLLFQHEYSANFLFTLWKRVRKYGAYCTGITQNVDDLLQSHTARTMLANSEFIIMLNQASTDRIELAKLLNISDLQMSYITNVGAGQGLLKVGSSLVPFVNKFPRNTELYKLMTTKFGEV